MTFTFINNLAGDLQLFISLFLSSFLFSLSHFSFLSCTHSFLFSLSLSLSLHPYSLSLSLKRKKAPFFLLVLFLGIQGMSKWKTSKTKFLEKFRGKKKRMVRKAKVSNLKNALKKKINDKNLIAFLPRSSPPTQHTFCSHWERKKKKKDFLLLTSINIPPPSSLLNNCIVPIFRTLCSSINVYGTFLWYIL